MLFGGWGSEQQRMGWRKEAEVPTRSIIALLSNGRLTNTAHSPKQLVPSPVCYNSLAMNQPAGASPTPVTPLSPIEAAIGGDGLHLLNGLSSLGESLSVPIYLVGGPIRDWLLGLPIQDLDFVVVGDAPEVARQLARWLGTEVQVHRRFGTATVSCGKLRTDLVTARREEYPFPGALPIVQPSTIHDDLARRDFTVNALAVPLGGDESSLLDPLGGRADLLSGVVRIIHPRSFSDDPTRLYRAVRYEQRLGFTLEPETRRLMAEAVGANALATVSGDRLRHELQRILAEGDPAKPLVRAIELDLLPATFSPLNRTEYVARWRDYTRTTIAPVATESVGPLNWLAALSYPLSTAEGEGLICRFNMPSSWSEVVRDTIGVRQLESRLGEESLLPSELDRLLGGFGREAVFAGAALTDSSIATENLARYLTDVGPVRPALSGRDLLALGVPAGPSVGAMLSRLRELRLDRRLVSEEDERQWVAKKMSAYAPLRADRGDGATRGGDLPGQGGTNA